MNQSTYPGCICQDLSMILSAAFDKNMLLKLENLKAFRLAITF